MQKKTKKKFKNLTFLPKYDIQCLAEKLAVSLSGIRNATVVSILDELQKSLIYGLKELKICYNLEHQNFQISQGY